MTFLSADPTPTPTPAAAPAAPAAPPTPAPDAADLAAKAAAQLYGDPPADPAAPPAADTPPADPAAPPAAEETAEQKAARLAAETPEQKAEREAKELKDAGAPEAYVDFTVPDGVELNAESLEAFKAIAKEDNLPQAQAQRYIDAAVKFAEARDAKGQAALDALKADWQGQTKADPEFGGVKLNESLIVAQKALKQFGTPELNELVVGAGLGDHPEFVRLMYRVGKAISEAPIVTGGKPASRDPASVMYPNLKQ